MPTNWERLFKDKHQIASLYAEYIGDWIEDEDNYIYWPADADGNPDFNEPYADDDSMMAMIYESEDAEDFIIWMLQDKSFYHLKDNIHYLFNDKDDMINCYIDWRGEENQSWKDVSDKFRMEREYNLPDFILFAIDEGYIDLNEEPEEL